MLFLDFHYFGSMLFVIESPPAAWIAPSNFWFMYPCPSALTFLYIWRVLFTLLKAYCFCFSPNSSIIYFWLIPFRICNYSTNNLFETRSIKNCVHLSFKRSRMFGLRRIIEAKDVLSMLTRMLSFLRHVTVHDRTLISLSRSSWYPKNSISLSMHI